MNSALEFQARSRKIGFDGSEIGQVLDVLDFDLPIVNAVTSLPQQTYDQILAVLPRLGYWGYWQGAWWSRSAPRNAGQ